MQQYFLIFESRIDYETQAKASGLWLLTQFEKYTDVGVAVPAQEWLPSNEFVIDEVGLDARGKYIVNVLATRLPSGLTASERPNSPRRVFAGF